MHVPYVTLFAKYYGRGVTISGRGNLNIVCCFKHSHTKWKYKFWRVSNFLSKCGLCTELKFTKYRKVVHCLYWALSRTK
jgi:hypothetical protein